MYLTGCFCRTLLLGRKLERLDIRFSYLRRMSYIFLRYDILRKLIICNYKKTLAYSPACVYNNCTY